jgi:hypothetical protein
MKTQSVFLWLKHFHTDARDDPADMDKPSRDLRDGMMPIILPDEHAHFAGWAPPSLGQDFHIPHGSVSRR